MTTFEAMLTIVPQTEDAARGLLSSTGMSAAWKFETQTDGGSVLIFPAMLKPRHLRFTLVHDTRKIFVADVTGLIGAPEEGSNYGDSASNGV